MGKLIGKIALERGHEISNIFNDSKWSANDINGADIAIEFSNPESALDNIRKSLCAGVSIVVGTTGWYNNLDLVKQLVKENNCSLIAATNFSIGVNIFYEINKKLASLMNKQKAYKPTLTETHHTQKLDSPSGTAITIADQVISEINELDSWEVSEIVNEKTLKIIAKREEQVPGTHQVCYESEIDKISISHEALNRKGFALGAVIAAEQIIGKKGFYTMSDIIKL
jgi:4-hydroxy-tetrahydrodipicolinate reductase